MRQQFYTGGNLEQRLTRKYKDTFLRNQRTSLPHAISVTKSQSRTLQCNVLVVNLNMKQSSIYFLAALIACSTTRNCEGRRFKKIKIPKEAVEVSEIVSVAIITKFCLKSNKYSVFKDSYLTYM